MTGSKPTLDKLPRCARSTAVPVFAGRVMIRLAAMLLVSVVAGCSTAPVYLKHTETGQIIQCGPYESGGRRAMAAALHESQCIADFQRQGYERVPSP